MVYALETLQLCKENDSQQKISEEKNWKEELILIFLLQKDGIKHE